MSAMKGRHIKLERVHVTPEKEDNLPQLELSHQDTETPKSKSSPLVTEDHASNPTNDGVMAPKSQSPGYVTINVAPEGTVSRSYASLTTIDTAVDQDSSMEATTAYVTYVEGTSEPAFITTSSTSGASVNGETITYPVFTVGESGTIYGSNGSQFYATNATPQAGITYAQEGGVTYLVTSTTNNDSNDSTSNANLDNIGQANVNHATRVSPATLATGATCPPQIDCQKGFIWLDEEGDEADYLNTEMNNEDTMGYFEDTIEDIVIMVKAHSLLLERKGTEFQSDLTKSCPVTVQWLLDNFERADGVSLPRSTMYYHYMRHCSSHDLDPVNAASFGKLIRSVFLGLRTRRLGTRGNSKYHYYGIRLKPDSALNGVDERMIDDAMSGRSNNSTINNSSNGMHNSSVLFSDISPPRGKEHVTSPTGGKRQRLHKSSEQCELMADICTLDPATFQRYLGDYSNVISNLPELDVNIDLPSGLIKRDLEAFNNLYRELSIQLLDDLTTFQFSDFTRRWRIFYRTETSPSYNSELEQYESILPKSKLELICKIRRVQEYVQNADDHLYQQFATILIPDVLRPAPSGMTQAVRTFAKHLSSCLGPTMSGYPDEMIEAKFNTLSAFGQMMRRYTSLNHVAQAARAVLQNDSQINHMLTDLNRIDFNNIKEQASWVSGCNSPDFVFDLEADFKTSLTQRHSLDDWAQWMESVVDRILRPYENTIKYAAASRFLLLKWSYYSSLIIRDLTLRSAPSFGSFHLLRLLYDEYMFYLIENRVARAMNTFPIALLRKKLMNPFDFASGRLEESDESFELVSNTAAKAQIIL